MLVEAARDTRESWLLRRTPGYVDFDLFVVVVGRVVNAFVAVFYLGSPRIAYATEATRSFRGRQ